MLCIIVPHGVASSLRARRSRRLWAVDPLPLKGRNENAIPADVLANPHYDEIKPDLALFPVEEIAEDQFDLPPGPPIP